MRKAFIECQYRYQAFRAAPWAVAFAKVAGGYWVFENITEYQQFIAQN